MNQNNYKVLAKIIASVETGGQIYGNARYDDYTAPYTNTHNEHTVTLGFAANYGSEAQKLITMIQEKDPLLFEQLDVCTPSIRKMLSQDWVGIRWNPSQEQKSVLIKMISSAVGRECQDELFISLMKTFVDDCERDYTSSVPAVMMYCEIRHLGGKKAADRIFKRCNGNYTLDSIMDALRQDQADTSSSNQAGDRIFWSRHEKCREFITKYAEPEDTKPNPSEKENQKPMASALSRAKTLLRQSQNDTMTGYTPDGKNYFVEAGAFTHTPKKGDIIYFYSTAKGRVGHVGIVERVDTSSQYVYTIEGNTSSSSYAENGGCVARHAYSYANQGGTNRVNGFGRPDFAAAGITSDDFVKTAISFLGYLEKRSNSQLNDKTANAGSNNYTCFQRDVGAGNGDQWCQYFVDAIALYTCQNASSSTEPKLNETVKWYGYVSIDLLNVRTWAGTENQLCSFSPLAYQTKVGVCDERKAANGDTWYYVLVDGKHGFVSGKYISKTKPESTPRARKIAAGEVMLTAVKDVVERAKNWTYGDSQSTIPCADGKISCDRLIARALYQLGFHDQRTGGETCGTLDTYLTSHGWAKTKKKEKIKPGAIFAVRNKKESYVNHVFVVSTYDTKSGLCSKYDTGSDERLHTDQPFTNVKLVEWSDRTFVCAWNPPAFLACSEPGIYVSDGVDYGPVFNPIYYAKLNPDLKKAYGADPDALFSHFLKSGMREGRQATAGFNVYAYKERYEKDLAYGSANLPKYYRHYCKIGQREGWIGI